jgi:hypothetical protein
MNEREVKEIPSEAFQLQCLESVQWFWEDKEVLFDL